ncbi:MAG: phage major capsid protein [Clostridia bacterium]|nr:phage major capsid protein [Clostridia bacterium]MBQ8554415.1 phage major capsid protein [Clostridia bacterium]MBQ8554458.1 phage major capsid protein [Clostridia bacterium]
MPAFANMTALMEAINEIQRDIPTLRDNALNLAKDKNADMAAVRKAKAAYEDANTRLSMLNEEKERMEDEATFRLRKKPGGAAMSKNEARGLFYQMAFNGGDTTKMPKMAYEQLGLIPADNADQGHGSLLVPETMANELLLAPQVTNPLRELMTVTMVPNLEIPRLGFEQDDDGFLDKDGASAKELALKGDLVGFGNHAYRVRASVSESIIRTTPLNIQSAVDAGLASSAARKELKMIFGEDLAANVKHMSLYQKGADGEYVIAAKEGGDLYTAWCAAFGDLEDEYRERAAGVLRFSDYLKMLRAIAPNANLFDAAPEKVLGMKVKFTERAAMPVVGDFKMLHLNFACAPWYDVEKVHDKGLRRFYLNSLYDIQVKMASAFRLVKVTEGAADAADAE